MEPLGLVQGKGSHHRPASSLLAVCWVPGPLSTALPGKYLHNFNPD